MSERLHEPSHPPGQPPPSPSTDPGVTAEDDLLNTLADEFAARARRGERPTVEEYVAKHPAHAERIRRIFPAIAAIEQTRPPDLAAAVGESPGSTIGRYKLLERIGEGGFGVVYMAEQQLPVRRKVALKVLKPGMDSRQVLARFEAERQALAIMDHPNIARVFDGGMTDSGRPYFVMELVKGEPITDYCDQRHLTPRQRLELFGQVCHAVQHAHQKGIIHRDIKPSNVLVIMYDTIPLVKVIDFGVAKALGQELTEKTLFTGFAQLVGTPLYMSPEQAGQSALDVDTRSDIYSLGVLLYELLTGTTPFDKDRFKQAAQDEIRRIIREEEPPRPSTRLSESKEGLPSISANRHTEPAKLTKLVRGELDWIVMKAMEKDRNRRYETATGLARDIERYLQDESVEACPPSTSYRLRKFINRHRAGAAAMAAVAAALLLGVAGTTVGLIQAKATLVVAEKQRAEAEHQRMEVQKQRVEAERQGKIADEQKSEAERQRNIAVERQQEADAQRQLAISRQQEAEEQRALAAAALAGERNAAEQERQAREAAVQAKRQAVLQLADSYTAQGIKESNSKNGLAALWFANAAITSAGDPDRARANLIRVNNSMNVEWTPVAAVGGEAEAAPGEGIFDHLAFNPEHSRYLMTFKRNGLIETPPQMWDLATEQPLHAPAGFDPPSDAVWTVAGRVLLAHPLGRVALASVPDMVILRQWDARSAINRIAAGPRGTFVAAAGAKKFMVWSVDGNADPMVTESSAEISYIEFSPTGNLLVTASAKDDTACLYAVESEGSASPKVRRVFGPVPHIYRAKDDFARPPVFVKRGAELVTVHEIGTPNRPGAIKWYDTNSGAELATTRNLPLSTLREITVSPNGNLLALAMRTSAVIDVNTRAVSSMGSSLGIAFSADDSFFAFSDIDIAVYRVSQNRISTQAFPAVRSGRMPAFSNDGKYMGVLTEGVTQILQLPSSQSLAPTRGVVADGRNSRAAFSPDGQYVAPIGGTGGTSTVRTIQVWTTATGKPAGKALALDADLVSADFSADGKAIAAVTGMHSDKKQLRLWDWQSGTLAFAPVPLDSEPVSLTFAPDGKAIAVHVMDGRAFLFDATDGHLLLQVKCSSTRATKDTYPWLSRRSTIGFSHDGATFFTWGSPVVQAWDRATGRERLAVRHTQDCWAISESPDGKTLATACNDGNLRFWDSGNGKEVRSPIEHPSQVLTVTFSPDGRLVGTACLDWQTRLWDVATGRLVCAMSSTNYLADLRFTPDGRFAVIANAMGLQLWDAKAGYAASQWISTGNAALPQIDISSDGHWAVQTGQDQASFKIVDLQAFTEPVKSSPEDALLWTELLSNARINGSSVVNLTNKEWLERWRQFRRQHPEFRPVEENNGSKPLLPDFELRPRM